MNDSSSAMRECHESCRGLRGERVFGKMEQILISLHSKCEKCGFTAVALHSHKYSKMTCCTCSSKLSSKVFFALLGVLLAIVKLSDGIQDLNCLTHNHTYLSAEDVNFFNVNGYLVIENFWNNGTVDRLRNKIMEIVDAEDLSEVKSIFSTKEQIRKSDDYFLESGGKVRFFWEEKAWKDDQMMAPTAHEAINKVGHALHDLVPEFQEVSYEPRIGAICRDLGLEKPLAVQSMYIFKQAKIGGEVVPHQDGSFLYTEPQSVIGFWWALDDCSVENGALWAVPGSHATNPVTRRFRRKDPPAQGTEFVPLEPVAWSLEGAVPLEIPRGSLVLLHSALVHYSAENTSPKPR
jgi:phytanoyl-CoA hydroxylase